MAYTKTNWQNEPSTQTPISAENLNHMEQGIYEASSKADTVEAKLDALQAREEAATAAAMTDTSKVYIYTGSEAGYIFGDWYYYNGSAWVSGGAYNSTAVNTDTTLAVSGAPADSKATGDAVTSLRSALTDISNNISKVEVDDVFSAFDARQTISSGTTFNGYATRYSYQGTINRVRIYCAYNGDGVTSDVTVSIYDGTFTDVIASKVVTVTNSNNYQYIDVDFDTPVVLNGNYYICILSDGYLRQKGTTSTYTTADSINPNYSHKPNGSWVVTSPNDGYCLDIILYTIEQAYIIKPKTIKYIGSAIECDYATVQDALNDITDDSASKQYVFYIMPGTYEPFSTVYSDANRSVQVGRARYISFIGSSKNEVVFTDNKGNYKFSPCEIWTNGQIKDISFICKTDAEHFDPDQNKSYAYAVHSDFGTCKTEYDNCYFYSNAGPSVGIGTWHNEELTFKNCTFENDTDGTYGASSLGAFYCHTSTAAGDLSNQNLTVENCVALMNQKPIGMKLSVISGYEGTYNYSFRNCGFFGKSSGHMVANVTITDPDNELLTETCYNNLPNSLNTAS